MGTETVWLPTKYLFISQKNDLGYILYFASLVIFNIYLETEMFFFQNLGKLIV